MSSGPNKQGLQDQICRGFILHEETKNLLEYLVERFATYGQEEQAMEEFSLAFAESAIASTQKYIDRHRECDTTPETS